MNEIKKEEYRYQFAGMVMQAIVNAIWSNGRTQDEAIATAKRLGYGSIYGFVTAEAAEYAHRLIESLEEENAKLKGENNGRE